MDVVRAFILGSLVEVAVPKPGNVSRLRDFEDLTFYHFLFANTALIGPYIEAVKRGILLKEGKIKPNEVGIGELIKTAVSNSKKYQDANPNFGVVTLSVPLIVAISSGASIEDAGKVATNLIFNSTPLDSVEFYKAIRIANPKGIPKGVKYDVYSDSSFKELIEDDINLWRLAEISCPRELIFCEWLHSYEITYETLEMLERLCGSLELEECIRKTFLELLARYEDTLILRKAGKEEAKLVKEMARKVLHGTLKIEYFERFMSERGDLRNPGSLADIMAVALSLLFCKGYYLRGLFLKKL
ncbi:triphosphoribosyl-dephospho-CoA synthase [Pyrococcus sp. ST04]|uniref:triphosphoribosyl-dephospho-CoA synthase n=1 Tax=Pyrococcus sp. ST04 TaxID=1183377 RepID=UPI0002605E29|nr:putative ATP:dephospho-CoA triphosphoribosyl transferase [Pyrococcus sp. ST04]